MESLQRPIYRRRDSQQRLRPRVRQGAGQLRDRCRLVRGSGVLTGNEFPKRLMNWYAYHVARSKLEQQGFVLVSEGKYSSPPVPFDSRYDGLSEGAVP